MKFSELLFKTGGTLWLLLVGGTIIFMLLHWLDVIDANSFNWKMFAAVFGVGGLCAYLLAGVLIVWDKDSSK